MKNGISNRWKYRVLCGSVVLLAGVFGLIGGVNSAQAQPSWVYANNSAMALQNGGTGTILRKIMTGGLLEAFEVGYVDALGKSRYRLVRSPSAIMSKEAIEAFAGTTIAGTAKLNTRGIITSYLARSAAFASSLPVLAISLGVMPDATADGTVPDPNIMPEGLTWKQQQAWIATGATEGCNIWYQNPPNGGTSEQYLSVVPCYPHPVYSILSNRTIIYSLTETYGTPKGPAYIGGSSVLQTYYETTHYYSDPPIWIPETPFNQALFDNDFDQALRDIEESEDWEIINAPTVTALQNGEFQELPPILFQPMLFDGVDWNTPLGNTNPETNIFVDSNGDTVANRASIPDGVRNAVAEEVTVINFPDVMDVNVLNWPENTAVPAPVGEVAESDISIPLLSTGAGWLPRSCPPPETFDMGPWGTGEIKYEPICDAVSMAGPFLVAFSFMIGAGIVFTGRGAA